LYLYLAAVPSGRNISNHQNANASAVVSSIETTFTTSTMDRFLGNVNKYIKPTQDDLTKILHHFQTKEIKKGRFLVRSGQTSNDFIFIDKGCLRVFWERDYNEVTGWFAFEDDFFCELSSVTSPYLGQVTTLRHQRNMHPGSAAFYQ